jgi:hypothetical protein
MNEAPNGNRLDRIEANLEKLTGVVGSLAASVVAHDDQIEQLIKLVEADRSRT